MNIKYALFNSSYRHVKYQCISDKIWDNKNLQITALKGEKFAFQIMLNGDEEFYCALDKNNNLSWKGLENRVRLELELENEAKNCFSIYFLGYIKDDTGKIVSDPILKDKGMLIEEGISQMLWVEGSVPYNWNENNLNIKINIYTQYGFKDEKKVCSIPVNINVLDMYLKPLKDSDFYLDLWQHPSNWARMYNVDLWSCTHWNIIENYIKELASMGEKVITGIVSDFPWAGQSCSKITKNASNLFEHNMVKIRKTTSGNFEYNFEPLDKYIEICMKYGIDKEIDLFGLLGNWDACGFGNPIKDYKDPIRLNYFDEESKTFKYINNKKDLKDYIYNLFKHLINKDLWNKVRIMSDEPTDKDVFKECKEFINSLPINKKILYKSALHDKQFMDNYKQTLDEISLSAPLTVDNINCLDTIKDMLNNKGGKLTWYVCCFPERPNNFISSPLIESRLIGWFTYYFGLDGFLRWDFAIWSKDPWNEPSYKFPKWKAGDMFFVYPGKDLMPVRSVRLENLRFGIQDFEIFKMIEKKGISKSEIHEKFMEKLLGKKDEMKMPNERSVELNYSLNQDLYDEIKIELLKKLS